jgi:hypothetical protein
MPGNRNKGKPCPGLPGKECGRQCWGQLCRDCRFTSRRQEADESRPHCTHPECGKKLSHGNISGKCTAHRDYRAQATSSEMDKVHRVLKEEASVAPNLSDTPRVIGSAAVLFDPHVPFHHVDTVYRLCEYSNNLGVRKLIIPGDLIHADIISKYLGAGKQVQILDEVNACSRVLDILETVFDEIHYVMGNHDQRVERLIARNAKTPDGKSIQQLIARLLDKPDDAESISMGVLEHFFGSRKVHVHPLTSLILNDVWLILHPGTTSRVSPQTERKLASKFLMHCIGGHNHLFGFGFHESGEYIAMNGGHASDNEKYRYVQERITTFPAMQHGFCLILTSDDCPQGRIFPVAMHDNYVKLEDLIDRARSEE